VSPTGGPTSRRRVLDAAAELLSSDGLDVPMEAIAERAGITRMTVYRVVGTRDELLVAVLLDQSARLVGALRAILDDEARPFTDRLVDTIVAIVLEVRASATLRLFVEHLTPSQIGALDRDDRFLGRVWALLQPYFDDAAATGALRNDAHATLDWTLRQILMQLVVAGTTNDTEEGLRAELEAFFVPSIAPR
jgi:AcrR family transcriptional regulator